MKIARKIQSVPSAVTMTVDEFLAHFVGETELYADIGGFEVMDVPVSYVNHLRPLIPAAVLSKKIEIALAPAQIEVPGLKVAA